MIKLIGILALIAIALGVITVTDKGIAVYDTIVDKVKGWLKIK